MILVIDLGTTGVRCIAYSDEWTGFASHYMELGYRAEGAGMFTQDLMEILNKTVDVLLSTWKKAGSPKEVYLGITNQRESLAVWNRKDGRPIADSLNWQDIRHGSALDEMNKNGLETEVHRIAGLRLFPYFTAGKMAWMLENVPQLRESCERGETLMGTLDTWLVWWLTGGPDGGRFVTDATNASRTCLMDLHTLSWSEKLLEWFNVPKAALAQIVPSGSPDAFGTVRHPQLPFTANIVSVIGDQQASLLGQSCLEAGSAKNTYGTASAVLVSTERQINTHCRDLLSTVHYQVDGKQAHYALEGSTGATGGIISWLRDNLRLFSSFDEASLLAGSVRDSEGVYFVPAFSGLYAPYWDLNVRGSIQGLTMHTNKAHIARAAFESIAFQTLDVINVVKGQAQTEIRAIKADGGASENSFLMQLQADILGIPVLQLDEQNATARGAAYLAGMTLGKLGIEEMKSLYQVKKTYEPALSDDHRECLYAGWKKAIARAQYNPQL